MSYFWRYERDHLMELRGPFDTVRSLVSDVIDQMPLPDRVSSINDDRKVRVLVFKSDGVYCRNLGFVDNGGCVSLLSDEQTRICLDALRKKDCGFLKTLEIGVSRVFAGD